MIEIGSILKLVRFLLAITVLALVAAVTFAVLATQPSDVKDEVLQLKAELRAIKVTIDENAKTTRRKQRKFSGTAEEIQ